MIIKEKIESFYSSVNNFSEKSKKVLEQVQKEKGVLKKFIDTFFKRIDENLRSISIKESNPLKEQVSELKNFLDKSKKQHKEEIKKLLEDFRFYEENIDSFIIVVFGKVNSGKSSLGNLIAGKKFDKWNISKPEFFQYIDHKKININDFEEKETESTAHIQGFKVGSLIWIDTPGIHSLTDNNEKLAKEFVDNADLIVYITSSDSPLRREDLNELKKLHSKEKSAVLIISKADTYEEDEIDGNLIKILKRKTDKDIQDQIDWCNEQINNSDLNNLLSKKIVIPISCKLAIEGTNTGNNDLVHDSGMNEFLQYMSSLIKDDGITHKIRNPKSRLSSLINNIKNNISEQTKSLSNLEKELKEYSKLLLRDIDGTVSIIVNNLNSDLELLFANTENDYKLNILDINQITEKLNAKINELLLKQNIEKVITERIKENLEKFGEKIKVNYSQFSVNPKEINKEDTIIYDNPYAKNIGKTVIGIGGYAAAGAGAAELGAYVGGTIGTVVGGPIGTFIIGGVGMLAGGLIGGLLGGLLKSEKQVKVNIGTNLAEECLRIKNEISSFIENTVSKVYKDINYSYFGLLEEIVSIMKKDLEELQRNIEDIKSNVEKIGI